MGAVQSSVESVVKRFPYAGLLVQGGKVEAECLSYRGKREPCHRVGDLVVKDGDVCLRRQGVAGCNGCSNDGTK